MDFQVALVIAAFLCALVAGFLLAFAAVVMQGIRNFETRWNRSNAARTLLASLVSVSLMVLLLRL